MDDGISQRIVVLRKHNKLTQSEFAERLNTTRSKISSYELNRVRLDNSFLDYICKVFDVNYMWLTTGEGDMFDKSDEALISDLTRKYNLNVLDIETIKIFFYLPPETREEINKYIISLLGYKFLYSLENEISLLINDRSDIIAMNLNDLIKYKNVIIQCHDNPDADAICSGFALQSYLRSNGSNASLVYGGISHITKVNLLMLLDMLKIEITHMDIIPPETDLLITVDCQRGAGNVYNFNLPKNTEIAVIDHHRPESSEGKYIYIRPQLASCCTAVWELLTKVEYKMESRVKTALYFGLFSDTNGMAELRHPLDRDLADLTNDATIIRKLKNSAITIEELDIISATLKKHEIIGSIGLFQAAACDANLLGFSSDIAIQVAHMDCCVTYSEQKSGLKLSIRSSVREIMASEFAAFICRYAGSGGGNIEKAGGFLSFAKIAEISGSIPPMEYLKNRVRDYISNYDLIYAGNNDLDFRAMALYKKLPIPVGFVQSVDVFPVNTPVMIRTLEGDVDNVTDENIYLIIGIEGEVYPIMKKRFEESYNFSDEPYFKEFEYTPSITNRISGDKVEILKLARTCVPKDTKLVRAMETIKDTKVFTDWDLEKYFHGVKGDYLVANEGSYEDCYIVRSDIFASSYEPYEG